MKPMLPSYTPELPAGQDWIYEVKYDGFRAALTVDTNHIQLTSRNGRDLLPKFPEIHTYVQSLLPQIEPLLPLELDGEITWLENPSKSCFPHVQWRGRLQNKDLIKSTADRSPCTMVLFDLLILKGKALINLPFSERRKALDDLCDKLSLPSPPLPLSPCRLQLIMQSDHADGLMDRVTMMDGEGIVAKQLSSKWMEGKRTDKWLKWKNWRTVPCFVTALNKENGYFHTAVFKGEQITAIGQVRNGMTPEETDVLQTLIKNNQTKEDAKFHYIEPAICIEVNYLHAHQEDELREPSFAGFLLGHDPALCTWERFAESQFTFPDRAGITSPAKPVWELKGRTITKIEYIQYLRTMSAWMLPFLRNRPLTAIRYPHGTGAAERFFQKNVPDYAPEFIRTVKDGDHEAILCNDLDTLVWLGNQLTIEFHTPFQQAGRSHPDELVLDLDPPGRGSFHMAVKAALEIKKTLDGLHMHSFVKTSGSRGLQVHIPLPPSAYSYEETRMFTGFLGSYLTGLFPEEMTTERKIEKRGGRLYLDFVQHHEGKTLIAPYSARGTAFAGVAAPLYWDQLKEGCMIEDFTILTVPEQVRKWGCPFLKMEQVRDQQPLKEVLAFLKKQSKI